MKPVLWSASMIGVFSLVFYATQSAFLALITTGAWIYVLGRWVHGPGVWKRAPLEEFPEREDDYAVSPFDLNATAAARSVAASREKD